MKPFVKWAGGKERELKYFFQYIPENIHNYIEPFVGGGAVYFALSNKHITGRRYINDFSSELFNLYLYIRNRNDDFFSELDAIKGNIDLMNQYAMNNIQHFEDAYNNCLNENSYDEQINLVLNNLFCGETRLLQHLDTYDQQFEKEIIKCLKIKVKKACKLKKDGEEITYDNLLHFFETSLKMSLYSTIRYAYNHINNNSPYKIAYFLYLREYCYSSMFRYNPDGEFNVPYGGMSYNTKNFNNVINYIKSDELINYLERTIIRNFDFEEFLNRTPIRDDDFIFIDPPYDSEFSEYAQNEFNRDDQTRLADCLANTNAKIMVVIKNTNFIYRLYHERGFYIRRYDKKYSVNFQNRNNREVEHLIITNYELENN